LLCDRKYSRSENCDFIAAKQHDFRHQTDPLKSDCGIFLSLVQKIVMQPTYQIIFITTSSALVVLPIAETTRSTSS
jgi:hypothetical protein